MAKPKISKQPLLTPTFDLDAAHQDGKPRIYSYTQIAGIRPGYAYQSGDNSHEVPEVPYKATWITFKGVDAPESEIAGTGPVALMFGKPDSSKPLPLVRIHSGCMTGDIFGAFTCDCGPQLTEAIKIMNERRMGSTIIYLPHHEGRGVGIANKIEAYTAALDKNLDTYETFKHLGHPIDPRSYKVAAQMLSLVGMNKFELLTGNPQKIAGIMEHAQEFGLNIVRTVPTKLYRTDENTAYLTGKAAEGAHKFEPEGYN